MLEPFSLIAVLTISPLGSEPAFRPPEPPRMRTMTSRNLHEDREHLHIPTSPFAFSPFAFTMPAATATTQHAVLYSDGFSVPGPPWYNPTL